ncbi:MAG: hypothetical protein D6832_02710 [Alphaproteobacteria bacterium]|nr:MAG: hypothetical protein D6832_02710 [Alphaproteobacteria bacterium]
MVARGRPSPILRWLKFGLPVLALLLLATLFLFFERRDAILRLDQLPPEVARLALETGFGRPRYIGPAGGGTLTLEADRARPRRPGSDEVIAEAVTARLEREGEAPILARAAQATLEGGAGRLRLEGGVAVDAGLWRARLAAAEVELERFRLRSFGGPVRLEGAPGELEAGAMRIEQAAATGRGGERPLKVVFTGGVRLIYRPRGQEKDRNR